VHLEVKETSAPLPELEPYEPRSEFPRYRRRGLEEGLARCEGLPVESPQGRVGVVAYLRYRSRHDGPDFLVVRTGHLSRRFVAVPVVVEHIDAAEGRVLVRAAPTPEPAGLLARLRRALRDAPRSSAARAQPAAQPGAGG
jgi:hypothetical protein